MAITRNDEWNSTREIYSAAEVESILNAMSLDIKDETDTHYIILCPYHGNTDSPAFVVNKTLGLCYCFNPACGKGQQFALTLEQFVRDIKHLDRMSAKRFIMNAQANTGQSFQEKFDSLGAVEQEDLPEFPIGAINRMHERFMETSAAVDYMRGRGFEIDTLEHFKVGFTPASTGPVYRATDMVVVPAFDHKSRPVGLVGRSIEGKIFKNFGASENGTGFKKSRIVWNLNNARRHETIILTESTFDAMRIHQAGYHNVGALLGGNLSRYQADLLNRHFTRIIIFTDNENEENKEMTYHRHCTKCLKSGYDMCQGHAPGRELGMRIADSLPRIRTNWAVYDSKHIYANNVKDAAAMTDDEIRQCLRNAVSHFDYLDMVA